MDAFYYTEYYLVDALRLARHFAEKNDGVLSEGIGVAKPFPAPPKTGEFPSGDVRFVRVECQDAMYCVAFVSEDDPPAGERKFRNKSLYRVLVGEEIRRCRQLKGMSLREVADKSGFRVHSLERIEEGRWDFDIAQLGVIVDALGAEVKIL